jgi:cullin 1
MADNNIDQSVWNSLEEGINTLMNHTERGLSYDKYMAIYTAIYNYCIGNTQRSQPQIMHDKGVIVLGNVLYKNLKDYLQRHLEEICHRALGLTDDNLLLFYGREWNKYTAASKYIHNVFGYLNRHWVKREQDEGHKKIYDVYTLCLISWRTHLFSNIHGIVMEAALKLTERHRLGEMIDYSLIKNISHSFGMLGLDEFNTSRKTLDIYKKYFEEPFIASTVAFYAKESEGFLSENPLSEYCKKAEARLREEEMRVDLYLDESSMKPLILACETVLIDSHKGLLVDHFKSMLSKDKLEDLERIFSLLERIKDGLEPLMTHFELYVRQVGLQSVAGQESDPDPKSYVDSLLTVYKFYYEMVFTRFKNLAGFMGSLDKACRYYINHNEICSSNSSKSPEILVKYTDAVLKKSAKNAEGSELEEILKNIMCLFKYIEDKDVFQKFYSKMLAKRLVFDTSVSEDAETNMITKLKEACGFEYTSKLSRMFTDMRLSKDINEIFSKKNNDATGIDFYIKVLCSGSWPLQSSTTPFTVPRELSSFINSFSSFYSEQHSGRKLNWLFHTSIGELKTNYLKGLKMGYIFQLYTYTLSILLLFNDSNILSVGEIMSSTGLSEEVVKGNVENLLKAKVLKIKDPKKDSEEGMDINENSLFELNYAFKSKKTRVNLKFSIKNETKAENEETHKTIEEDRKLLIQASIVRIMKTRKVLKHIELVQEVIQQLLSRFKPKISDIKKCVEILLEKEYIERVEGQKDTFSYLA